MSIIYGTSGDDSLVGRPDGPGNPMDYLVGAEGDDTLAAGGVLQTLDGLDGEDVLIGTRGTIAFGGNGDDLLQGVAEGYGDAGNDTIIGGAAWYNGGGAKLYGGPGDDSIVGTAFGDFISGGGGANVLSAGDGDDVFVAFAPYFHTGVVEYGTVWGDWNPGSNTIDGGAGQDTLNFAFYMAGSTLTSGKMVVDLASGTATTEAFTYLYYESSEYKQRPVSAGTYSFSNFENALTGGGDDSINGSSANNILQGRKGSDTIHGGGGDDTIYGDGVYSDGDASNVLWGEGGDDAVTGGSAADQIDGGTGADTLNGGQGADLLLGGDGDDSLNGGMGADMLSGGAGADTFGFFETERDAHRTFADVVTDWSSADRLWFASASSGGYVERTAATYDAAYDDATAIIRDGRAVYVATQVGGDVVVFSDTAVKEFETQRSLDDAVILQGRSLDDISAANVHNAIAVDLGADWTPPPSEPTTGQPPAGGGQSFDTISPTAALAIGATDKVVFTSGTATQASVIYGADTITIVMGGTSVAFGTGVAAASQAGNLVMADGSSFFIGLGDPDVFLGGDTGDAAFGGLGNDTLDGGAGSDLLQGNQGADRLLGGDGDDTIYGGQDDDSLTMGSGANFGQGNKGADTIAGGSGADTLLGGQDSDVVVGGEGSDFLNGNRADDSISGGGGADTLYGEGGDDTLAGGAGADVFHGFVDGGLDRVIDFNAAEGDRIVLDSGVSYSYAQVGADVVVTYGSNQIVLVGVSLASLSGEWISQ